MIFDVTQHLADEILRLNPNVFTEGKLVTMTGKYVVDLLGNYSGLEDNKQTYLYVRIYDAVKYDEVDEVTLKSCDAGTKKSCVMDVTVPVRIVIVSPRLNHSILEQRLRECFCEMRFDLFTNKSIGYIFKNEIYIRPILSYMNTEVVAELELGEDYKKWRDDFTFYAMDIELIYLTNTTLMCEKTDLCNPKNLCEIAKSVLKN